MGSPCLASERAQIAAVIRDDAPVVAAPVWPRSDVVALADRLLTLACER
ncbi:MAG: hypothetical protein ACYC0X_10675 [Pirellulaceae bacterium]